MQTTTTKEEDRLSINDRWHTGEKQPGGKQPRSAEYGCRERWQVRWRDEQGRQRKKSFARKLDAEAFEAKVKTQLQEGTYVDPSAGDVTLQVYAEAWRQRQTHDTASAERVAGNLRRHVYSAPGTPGRTPTGAPSIGDYPLRILARQPSIVQGWLAAIPLHPNSVRMVAATVTPVFTAAAEDGLIARNPLRAKQVKLPKAVKTDVAAWSAEQVAAVADALPARWSALAALGAAVGMRQGELFALAVDDLDFLRRNVHVAVQIKRVGGRVCFAPTKNRKIRDVPVSARVIPHLAEHVRLHPPAEVTLPWHDLQDPKRHGQLVTRRLMFTKPDGAVLDRMMCQPGLAEGLAGRWRPRRRPERDARPAAHRRVSVAVQRPRPGPHRRVPRRHPGSDLEDVFALRGQGRGPGAGDHGRLP